MVKKHGFQTRIKLWFPLTFFSFFTAVNLCFSYKDVILSTKKYPPLLWRLMFLPSVSDAKYINTTTA